MSLDLVQQITDNDVYEDLPDWFNRARTHDDAQDIVVDSNGTARVNMLGHFTVIGNMPIEMRMRFLRKAAQSVGRFFDDRNPVLSAVLPNNERLEAVHVSVCPDGPGFAMRIPGRVMTLSDMRSLGSINDAQGAFLSSVAGTMNVVVSGWVGSGKTTLVRALLEEPAAKESRQVIIETDPEAQRPWNGLRLIPTEEFPFETLLRSALRLIPEMLIISEVRDGKHALAFVHAARTGHVGMSTVHARGALMAPRQIFELGKFVGGIPTEDVAMACEVVVHVEKTGDGGRRVSEIVTIGVKDERFVCEKVA